MHASFLALQIDQLDMPNTLQRTKNIDNWCERNSKAKEILG